MRTGRSQAERSEATRRRLLEVGRELFARNGYTQTATEDIVQQAGVTRGALYHHFQNKEGLFVAVLQQVQQEVGQQVEEVAMGCDRRWEQLQNGCRAFLEASTRPEVRRIMLIDAPAVVGWDTWRHQDAKYSMASLQALLSEMVEHSDIPPLPITATTHLLSGAMNEAALWVAQSEDPARALAEALAVLNRLLTSLRDSSGIAGEGEL